VRNLARLFEKLLRKGRPGLLGSGAIFVLAAIFSQTAIAQQARAIVGVWTTESKTEINIVPCATGYCGSIVKVSIPKRLQEQYANEISAMQGNILDGLNKDASLRNRPLLGLEVLTLQPVFIDGRLNGVIYNAEDGNTYEGFLEIVTPNKIRLSGCVFFNLICLGEDWVRTSSL